MGLLLCAPLARAAEVLEGFEGAAQPAAAQLQAALETVLQALDLDDVAAACLGLGLVAGHVVADHAAGHGAGHQFPQRAQWHGSSVAPAQLDDLTGAFSPECRPAASWLRRLAPCNPPRATRAVPGFHAALTVCLVEASPVLRARQAQALAGYAPVWCDTVPGLPQGPLYLLANEFFDALPIHQYQRTQGQWRERLIGLQTDHLAFGIAPDPTNGGPGPRFAAEPEGTVVETCPQARPYMATIQHRLHAHGGLALIVDYGGWRSKGDTLQAMKDHAYTDPLAEPGRADLTAHVDFQALAAALRHRHVHDGHLPVLFEQAVELLQVLIKLT